MKLGSYSDQVTKLIGLETTIQQVFQRYSQPTPYFIPLYSGFNVPATQDRLC